MKKIFITFLFLFPLLPLTSHAIFFPNRIDTKQEKMNIQTVLNTVMSPSPNLVIDGIIGKKSIQAIKDFQNSYGLVVDGDIGPITRATLEKAQTEVYPTTQTNNIETISGCSPGALFNVLTGQRCRTLPVGCNGSTSFSPITGADCSISIPVVISGIILNSRDATPPVISSVGSSGITETTATITWTTDKDSTSLVEYGITTSYGSTESLATYTTSHSISLTGLTTNTAYHYKVTSVDASTNSASSTDYTFTTLDLTAPTVDTFVIPSTSSSLTVSITDFTASDTVGVTGYLLTESATAPLADDAGWVASAPATYVFTTEGTKTLYAWVKDLAGNVSTSLNREVVIAVIPVFLTTDGYTEGWYSIEEANVTKDVNDLVSQWNDLSGNANHLVNADGIDRPLWTTSDGMQFDGIDDYLSDIAFQLPQPISIYLVFRQDTWTDNDTVLQLNEWAVSGNVLLKQGNGESPQLQMSTSTTINNTLALDTWGVITVVINGVSSLIQVNDNAPVIGDLGTRTMEYLSIGGVYDFADVDINELIIRSVVDDTTNQTAIINYLNNKYTIY